MTFQGRWHAFDDLGLNNVLTQPIPIWIGAGNDERALRRVARFADGFLPLGDPTEPMARVRQYMAEDGRDPTGFGLTGRLIAGSEGPEAWLSAARTLQGIGVTQLNLTAPPDLAPTEALERIIEARQALAAELG